MISHLGGRRWFLGIVKNMGIYEVSPDAIDIQWWVIRRDNAMAINQ